jgi:putative membrane protein
MQTKWILAAVLSMGLAARADEAKQALNDPQIATVALTAHQIDIDRGKVAMRKTKNAEVKQFAEQMVHDHEAGKAEVLALAKQLGVKPEESGITKSLKGDAKKVAKRLAKEKGAAFDKDYIDTEVAYHQAVIDAVNKVLIPGAQNAQVKTALQNTVPTLEGHLQHAKNVQAQLPAKSASK